MPFAGWSLNIVSFVIGEMLFKNLLYMYILWLSLSLYYFDRKIILYDLLKQHNKIPLKM